jgi:hypothetical protein
VARGETSYVNENGAATVAVTAEALAATPPPAPVSTDTTFFQAAQPGATVQTSVAATILDVAIVW